MPAKVITLVHGTWAPDADWVKPESAICKSLSELGGEVVLRSFRWSGRNSHRARLSAAEELARQLDETCRAYPDAEHHVLGHSHGGNVALYALRDPRLSGRIASVVCLATPFIHAEARPVEPAMLVIRALLYTAAFAPIAILGILSLVIAVFLQPQSEVAAQLRSIGVPQPVLVASLLLFWCLVLLGSWRIARKLAGWTRHRLRPRIEAYQQRLVNEYRHHTVVPLPVLNAQVKGDEPAGWLRLLRRVSEPAADSRAALGIAAILALTMGAMTIWSWVEDGTLFASLFDAAIGIAVVGALTYLAWLLMLAFALVMSHLIFIMMPLLVRAHGGGFGEWGIVANWLAVIEARDTPGGGFRVETFRVAPVGKGLRHSRIYGDARVIERVCSWLRPRARTPDGEAAGA